MVAQSSSTVARSGVSMVSWAVWVLLVFFGLSHAHANSDSKYGDVSGEEVVIDQLEDYLRGHHNQRGQDHAPHSYRPTQAVNEKIHFAVTPKDPRYYFPISRPHAEGPSEEDFLRLLSPDLNLQNQQGFPGELQYQDEDAQYQAEYPHQYQPRFPEAVRYPAQFLSLPNIKYPGRDLFSGRQVGGPQDPSLAEATALDGGTDELTDNEREESKRMMMEEIENNAEKQSLKNFVEENVKAQKKEFTMAATKGTQEEAYDYVIFGFGIVVATTDVVLSSTVATSQPEAVNYMHLHRTPSEAREAGYALHAEHKPRLSDIYFTALVAGCTAVAVCGIVGAGICWYR
nr:uncharacterized protein LOC128687811 [Cherax quadricarinatus]